MTDTNEITGDRLISKVGNKEAFDRGWDTIFSKIEKNRRDCQCSFPDFNDDPPDPTKTTECCGDCG